MPQLLSLLLVFVLGIPSAQPRGILSGLLLLLGIVLRGLIDVLRLEVLAIVWPSLGMTVDLHLAGVSRWICHTVVGIV